MTEPQVWTLMGVFAAALVGMLSLVSSLFLRVLRAETAALRAETATLGAHLEGLMSEMSTRLDGMALQMVTRMDGLDGRLDHIDRDVQTLARHVFPERS